MLTNHVKESESTSTPIIILHIVEMPQATKKQQFLVWASISNYHWFKNTMIGGTQTVKEVKNRFSNHMFFQPQMDEDSDESHPRMHLLVLLSSDLYEYSIMQTIRDYFNHDNPHDEYQLQDPVEYCEKPPRKKRRKQAAKLITVSPDILCEGMKLDLTSVMNSATENRSLYTNFKESLLLEGRIIWRIHTNELDVCLMNNYHASTGVLLPTNYVHVTCIKKEFAEPIIRCSCVTYEIIQCSQKGKTPIWPRKEGEEEESLADTFTCMLSRFYQEHLLTAFDEYVSPTGNLNMPLQMVPNSLHQMNVSLLLAGYDVSTGMTKFSIKGSNNCSILHVTFYQNKCFIKCLNGLCAVQLTNKKKFAKSISLQELQQGRKKKKNKEDHNKLCEHIHVVYNNLQSFKESFPYYFNENQNCIQLQPGIDAMNLDDANIAVLRENFEKETELWDFEGVTQHKPLEMCHPELVIATEKRKDPVSSETMNRLTGKYMKLELKAGVSEPCECGAGYEVNHYKKQGTATLYTHMGPEECTYYSLESKAG